MAKVFGVDLGTGNIKVYNGQSGNIIKEKNTLAIINRNQLFAYGNNAYEMFEKTPPNINICFPVSRGVISDFNNLQFMITEILEDAENSSLKGSEFVVAVPTDITEVEKKAFFDMFYKSKMKPKTVRLCDKPIADAVGIGLDVTLPIGQLVVDMGADTTEISVISVGGLVVSKLLKIGGNQLDERIISYIRKTYNLQIGKKSAQVLKESIGDVFSEGEDLKKIIGQDVVTGLPIEIEISSKLIHDAMQEPLETICACIRDTIEHTPPELSKDIKANGIYLTGGSSKLKGMKELFESIADIRVTLAEDPDITAAKGLAVIALDKKYDRMTYTMRTRIFR